MNEMISMYMFGKELQGEFSESLKIPKLSVVGNMLKIMGRFGLCPNTSSYGDRFILVLTCELIAKGITFTFYYHVSYCVSKILRTNVFNWQLLFSTSPLDHGAYGVRGSKCILYVRQKCANSPLIYSFPLSDTKISGIPNLLIQWSNNTVSAFVEDE